MITIQVSVSKGWLHQEGGFRFPDKYYFDPIFRWNQDRESDLFVSKKSTLGYNFANFLLTLWQMSEIGGGNNISIIIVYYQLIMRLKDGGEKNGESLLLQNLNRLSVGLYSA